MNRSETLKAAEQCVCGDREEDYGNPENNFARIAALWSAYKGQAFTALDVAMMMALLKIARVASGRIKEDNFVDLAGYAACAGEIAGGEQRTEKIIGIGDGLYICSDGTMIMGGENEYM